MEPNITIYVEKVNREERYILFDFVNKGEFDAVLEKLEYVCNRALRITESEEGSFQKSIISLKINDNPDFKYPTEGKIYRIRLENLVELIGNANNQSYLSESSPSILLQIEINERSERILSDVFNKGSYTSRKMNYRPCSEEELKAISLDISNSYDVVVKNVGHGNWNQIISNSGRNVMFDFGCSTDYSNTQCSMLLNNSLLNTPWDLIISHWDLDHYNLLITANGQVLGRIKNVYAPNNCITLTSQNVVNKLNSSSINLKLIAPINKRVKRRQISLHEISAGNNWTMFCGEKSSSTNNSGLALAVYNYDKCVYLCADHTYNQSFDDMHAYICSKIYSYKCHFVVPHHGRWAGKYNIANYNTSMAPGFAVASCSRKSYGGPLCQNINMYKALGFNWIETEAFGDVII